jgi:TM2 domain-containing membrane protein YozV
MLGLVRSYDPETETGKITIGKENFDFDLSVWLPEAAPEEGDEVSFDLRGKKAYNINLRGAMLNKADAVKIRWVAVLLSLLFGWIGIHRIYLGYYRIAFMQCVLTGFLFMAGLPGYVLLWPVIDAFLIFAGHIDKDAKLRPLK